MFGGWNSAAAIKATFENTTQFAKSIILGTGTFRRHFKTRFPGANTPRCEEAVSSDYIPVGVPAVDDSSTGAQIFSGVTTRFLSAYGVKSDKEFVGTLEDEIRKRGAMDVLVTDSAASETSKRVEDVLHGYKIDAWQSEAGHRSPTLQGRSQSDYGLHRCTCTLLVTMPPICNVSPQQHGSTVASLINICSHRRNKRYQRPDELSFL